MKLLGIFLTGSMVLAATAFAAPAINNGSPSCPFPRNADYPFGLQPNGVPAATMNAAVSTFYVQWYNAFVTTNGAGGNIRVQGGVTPTGTVSEGIGYGMLIAAAMGDKPLFDGLFAYYNAHLDAAQLMNWTCDTANNCSGNAATDADQDVAFALYMAGTQWGGTYNASGNTVAGRLIASNCFQNDRVTGGDQNAGVVYPDYCAPGWYRCFQTKTGQARWGNVTNWVYGTLFPALNGQWPYGYVPNRVGNPGYTGAQAISPETALNHGYDAARMGWRMGLDYLWNGSNQGPISLFANSVYNGVNANGFINYIQEYWNVTNGKVTGQAAATPLGSPCSPLQVGPALVGCMAGLPNTPANQDFVNALYAELIDRINSTSCPGLVYFEDTLALMCLLAGTGNFPNIACGACPAVAPQATPTAQACMMIDDLEDGNLTNAVNGFWFTFAYNSVNNTPVATPGNAANDHSHVSGVTYLVDGTATGTGAVAGSLYSARVTGNWTENGQGSPATYGGFAIATEINAPYRNMTSMNPPGGGGPASLTQVSFYIKASKATNIRLNFYNPVFDPKNPAGACGVWANQYGFTFPVNTSWQKITITRYQINCQDWGGTGNCGVTCGGTPYTRDLALSNITSLQWLTVGNGDTVNYWVDNVCLAFNRGSVIPYTATPIPTYTFTPGAATNTPTRTFTPTFTSTNTSTRTNTATFTPAVTNTPTPTATFTRTSTATFTSTFTNTRTNTPTNTPPANTNTPTPTSTFTSTRTNTSTFTITNTPPANTNTPTPTSTFTNTRTNTATFTATFTNTRTNTPTVTNSFTNTPAITNTPTNTGTFTSTFTNTRTSTPSFTATFTNTRTNTPTFTSTFTFTNTRTNTATSTNTFTPTITATPTHTFTGTAPPTNSPTNTATHTRTFTSTFTFTNTHTLTSTRTPTSTFTSVFTNTPTFTGVFTNTSTNTPTRTPTATNTPTNTVTNTSTFTNTRTSTPSFTNTLSPTNTGTPTNTFTGTVPPSNTPTNSATPTATPTFTSTFTNTRTSTPSFTNTRTNTPSFTNTPIFTNTPTFTNTRTNTPTLSSTATSTSTGVPTNTPTAVIITVASGPSSPSNSTQLPGSSNVPVFQFQAINPSSSAATLTSVTLSASGTGNDQTGITGVSLYLDADSSGTFTGGDVLLASGTYPADNGNLTLNFNRVTNPSTTDNFLVVYDFSGSAPAGTYTTRLANNTSLTGTGGNFQALNFTGAPVTGATVTIATATSTPTNTSTITLSPTRTPSPTPVVVQISAGPANPSGSTQLPGSSNVPVLQVQASNMTGQSATLTSLQLTAAGSGNDATGINSVSLYRDANNNGIVDGPDTLLATGAYVSDNGVANLSFAGNVILPGSTVNYLVVYDFSTGASGSFQTNVTANTSLSGTSTSGQPLAFTGAPIGGSTFTAASATATATVTSTTTAVPTRTPTATATSGTKPVIYPNPADGTKPVNLQLNLSLPTDTVTLQIFTVAFRKVQEMTLNAGSPGVTASAATGTLAKNWTVPVPLTDKWGAPLASGLYYVVATSPNGSRTVTKLLVVR